MRSASRSRFQPRPARSGLAIRRLGWFALWVGACALSIAAPAGLAAQTPTIQDSAARVQKLLDAARKASSAGEVPFFFGHFAAIKATAEAGPSTPASAPEAAASAAPPPPESTPEVKFTGVLQLGGGMQVISESGTHSVGDTVQGCTIKEITGDVVTLEFKGKTFTRPTK
jgi:hypothetical protein